MRKKILLVDDDEATRGFLSMILDGTGYDVVATYSVQEGKSLLERLSRTCSSPTSHRRVHGLQLIAMSPRRIAAVVTTGFPDPVLEARPASPVRILLNLSNRRFLKLLSELLGDPT